MNIEVARELINTFHYQMGRGGDTYLAILDTPRGVRLLQSADRQFLVDAAAAIPHTDLHILTVTTCH